MAAASNTVTLAASWPVGASPRVAVTTTDSLTGAIASVKVASAVADRSTDAGVKPGSAACARHRWQARSNTKLPAASVNVVVTTASSAVTSVTGTRAIGAPALLTTRPRRGVRAVAVVCAVATDGHVNREQMTKKAMKRAGASVRAWVTWFLSGVLRAE